VIVVLDQAQAQRDLAAAALPCPSCGGQLRPWGFARVRSLRLSCGGRAWLRPQRARCRDCRQTQVLLPARAPLRHADAIEVVGAALLAHAAGQGLRTIATELDVPVDTVRRWLRRVTSRAEWLRQQGTIHAYQADPMLAPIVPSGTVLADALSALGTAAAAVVRRLGPIAPPWQLIASIAGGRLLAPLRSG
jgi:transposase-like protein